MAILVFVMSLGFFLASRKSSNNEHKSFKEIISGIVPSVKKAVVGDTNLDLIDQSQEAHRIIDEIIINNKDKINYPIFDVIFAITVSVTDFISFVPLYFLFHFLSLFFHLKHL